MEKAKELYFFIVVLKNSSRSKINDQQLKEQFTNINKIKTFNMYKSLKADSDYIIWCTADSPESFITLKESIGNIFDKFSLDIIQSYLSIYERSPYLKNSLNIEDQIRNSTRKYLIVYPMSKSNDWYLLPYEKRKEVMDEHIKVAMTDENNKDILSYTTYSFGIGDQEFVVLYETNDLYSWMKVTQRLREVEARKWITKETPIFTGIRI